MAYVRDHIGEDYTLLRPDALAYPMLAAPSSPSLSAAYDTGFTYDLEVTVPSGTTVACGGLPGGVSTSNGMETFRFTSRIPTWRIDIAAAKFKVLKNDPGNLVVYALLEDEAGGVSLLKEMHRVMEFYTLRFGPSNKATSYTVIEIPGGWGSQASDFYILQAAAAFKDPKSAHELYHEIGHSWNAKTKSEVKRTRWFDEAFAAYFEALALREFAGQKEFDDQMAMYREHFRDAVKKNSRNATTPIAEYGKEELGGNSYTKGAWSLFVLNQIVGDEKFSQTIRAFLAEFSDRPAGFAEFQSVAERVSKRELSRFFKEWIFGADSSELLIGNASIQEIVERYRVAAKRD
jgi:aminopeptidase N